jgi:hypothetical protein
MENVKAFFHKHPIESALLGGAAIIALYIAFKPRASSDGGQEAALQNAYFQAEAIQAQSGAAIQVANIQAGRDTAIAKLAADTSTTNATTWANEDIAVTNSNNDAAIAGYPYALQAGVINSLASIAGQTQTTQKSSSGFFGIGASNKTTTQPTQAALSASEYLNEIANGLFASH